MRKFLSSYGRIIGILAVVLITAVSCEDTFLRENDQLTLKTTGGGEECGPVVYTLWGGQTIDVGTVTVNNDDENIYVTYETTGGWLLTETHLYVLDYMPEVRLTPGKAPYKSGDISYVTTYTFTVPLEFGCNDIVWLQAHAAVVKLNDEGEVIDEETGYGGNVTKPKKGSWYGNIQYVVQCCDYEEPPVECSEETAWGGDSEGEGKAWWYYYDGNGSQTIWAGQHIEVGYVEIADGVLYITLTGGWELQNDGEAVKIQGYDVLPSTRPTAGLFTTYKGTDLTVGVDEYPFYAIHLDVMLCE